MCYVDSYVVSNKTFLTSKAGIFKREIFKFVKDVITEAVVYASREQSCCRK